MEVEAIPFWLVSTPIGSSNEAAEWNKLTKKVGEGDTAQVFRFQIPTKDLKVGTLDNLMSLSDDLVRMDTMAEATTFKIYKQLMELQKDAGQVEEPTIRMGDAGHAMKLDQYLCEFKWDEAKYPVKSPLRELSDLLTTSVSRMDDELKAKATEFQSAKGAKQALERKDQGNLMVRSLADIVNAKDFVESEHLTTLLVVVPKFALKEWETSYASLGGDKPFVVPNSSRKVHEDTDTVLMTVTLFKSIVDDFKANCREKRFIVRDFEYSEAGVKAEKDSKEKALSEHDKVKAMFIRWCKTNLAEAYSAMVHLKAVRVFVESVLRYGVPPNFQAALLKPAPRKEVQLRKHLDSLYQHLAASDMTGGDEDMPGQAAEFYPYVFFNVYTSPPSI